MIFVLCKINICLEYRQVRRCVCNHTVLFIISYSVAGSKSYM